VRFTNQRGVESHLFQDIEIGSEAVAVVVLNDAVLVDAVDWHVDASEY
jgi:hypothetical protein